MKIYFCGSIRGGYQDAKLYQDIIGFMKRKHKVLTEHIGRAISVKSKRSRATKTSIFRTETGWKNPIS